MKHYTYKTLNTNTTSKSTTTNFSKILDNIILSDIKKQNSFLNPFKTNTTSNKTKKIFINTNPKNINTSSFDLFDAIRILDSYGKNNIKFTKGEQYFIEGTPIIFYDDEIQIGFDIYSYDDLSNIDFIKCLTPEAKETITKISIKIYNI